MRHFIIFLAVSATAGATSLFLGAPVFAALPNYSSLAKSVYGDEICSTVLMSVDMAPGVANGASVVATGARPRNTSCVLLQSYVRMPGANVTSREIVATAGVDSASPQSFGASTLTSLRSMHGEIASADRVPKTDVASAEVSVLKTTDGKWRIVFGGNMYDLDWQPTAVRMNPVTRTPYAVGANGHLWTLAFHVAYQTWDAKGEAPVVRAIDSKGNLLVTSLVYDRLYDLWINKRYVGRYSEVDRDPSIAFADQKSVEAYYPGYVMTFADAIGFDQNDHLVIYRQEGRVFTRTAYDLK